MAMPPLKHVIDQQSVATNLNAASLVIPIAVGTVNPNSYTTPTQVRHGSKVTRLTLQLDFSDLLTSGSVGGAQNFMDWYVWFNVGGTQARPNPNSVNISTLKNQIFHQDGTIFTLFQSTAVGYAVPWKNSWRVDISIPRSYQQVNENDVIELVINSSVNAASSCVKVKVIYKEIFP